MPRTAKSPARSPGPLAATSSEAARLRVRLAPGAVLALATLAGCQCGDLEIRSKPPRHDLAIHVRGAVSCDGAPVELPVGVYGGSPPYAFRWEPAEGLSDPNAAAPLATSGVTRDYTVTVKDKFNVTRSAMVTVVRRSSPKVALVAPGGLICGGDEVDLAAALDGDDEGSSGVRFTWSVAGEVRAVSREPFFRYAPNPGEAVELVAENEWGCTDSAQAMVPVRAAPTAELRFLQGGPLTCGAEEVELGVTARDAEGSTALAVTWDLDGNPASVESTGKSSGVFIPSGSTARVTVRDSVGCATTLFQELMVEPLPQAVIGFRRAEPIFCEGEAVTLHGLDSHDGMGGPVTDYEWVVGGTQRLSGAQPPLVLAAGTHEVNLVVRNGAGCSAAARATVVSRRGPTAHIGFRSGSVNACAGSSLVLTAEGSTSSDGRPVTEFLWDFESDGKPDSGTRVSKPFSASGPQKVTLAVADELGCVGSTELLLQPRGLPTPHIRFVSGSATMCGDGQVNLDASGSRDVEGKAVAAYAWDLDATPATTEVAGAATGAFAPNVPATVTVTDRAGCRASLTQNFTRHPVPVADAGTDRAVALGGTVRLEGSARGGKPGYTFRWTPATALDDANLAGPRSTPTQDTTYTLQVTDANGCKGQDSTQVRVGAPLTVDAGPDLRLCTLASKTLPLEARVSGGIAPLTYEWTASPACAGCIAQPTAQNTVVTPTANTTFTVTVRDANGTTATDSVAVRTINSITAYAGEDRRLRAGEATRLGGPGDPDLVYEWTCSRNSCGLSDYTVSDPVATPGGTTTYTVKVSDGRTCTATASVTISMEPKIIATVPPDGVNWWARDTPLWALFDTDLDAASLAGNVELIDPSDGLRIWIRVSYVADYRMIRIDPLTSCNSSDCSGDKPYWNNRPYVLALRGGPTGIRSSAPYFEPLYGDNFFDFIASSMGDGAAPAYLHRFPAPFATGVSRNAQVEVRFDEPLAPASVHSGTIFLDGIPTEVRHDERTYTVTVRPLEPLPPNTVVNVVIAGITDAIGNAQTVRWSFTTGPAEDLTPPTVVSASPVTNTVGVNPAGVFRVTFNEPIDMRTVQRARFEDAATRQPVPGQVTYDVATRTLSFEPQTLLEPSRTYSFWVKDVANHAGLKCAQTTPVSVTTAGALLLERFEGPLVGWTLAGSWGTDFHAARTGAFGLTDRPGAHYLPSISSAATTPSIPVSGRASVTVSFSSQRMLAADGDRLHLEYQLDSGAWLPVREPFANPDRWRKHSYSVPTSGAASLRVRFRLATDANLQLDGWFMDDLLVR